MQIRLIFCIWVCESPPYQAALLFSWIKTMILTFLLWFDKCMRRMWFVIGSFCAAWEEMYLNRMSHLWNYDVSDWFFYFFLYSIPQIRNLAINLIEWHRFIRYSSMKIGYALFRNSSWKNWLSFSYFIIIL